jgi:hypothetical protein
VFDYQLAANFVEHHRAKNKKRIPPDLFAEPVEDKLIPRMLLEKLGDRIGVE